MVDLNSSNHVSPFLHAASIPRNNRAHRHFSKEELLYLPNMVWKAASREQMSRSGMVEGKDAVKEVWSQWQKMSSQSIGDVNFLKKRAETIGAGYVILACFADPMKYLEKLLQNVGLPRNYKSMFSHAFMAWLRLKFSGEVALKLGAIRSCWNPIFISVILDHGIREQEERIGRYTSMISLHVEHVEMPEL